MPRLVSDMRKDDSVGEDFLLNTQEFLPLQMSQETHKVREALAYADHSVVNDPTKILYHWSHVTLPAKKGAAPTNLWSCDIALQSSSIERAC